MTIPQIDKELSILAERADRAEQRADRLQEDLSELRGQLGIERPPVAIEGNHQSRAATDIRR